MSGVVALFHRGGEPVGRRVLNAMLAASPWLGLDGSASHVDGSVGVGHARLVVTPEDERERQPLVSPRTGSVIVADVRLDNRGELLNQLGAHAATGDAELILRAYEAWGIDGFARLLGDFAFVIWDPRSHRLVCGRDTSGQRQLFYRLDAGSFAAASEIHQLFQDPAVPFAVNEERIREYITPINLRRNLKDPHETFYQGIYSLPAAHVLIVERDRSELKRYWEFTPPAELRYRAYQEYADHLRGLFEEVVAVRLRSARPVGALLSGGLDSSSIVCVTHELMRSGRVPAQAFTSLSYVYEDLDCNEQELTLEIDAKYGVQTRFIPGPQVGGWLRPEPDGFVDSPAMGLRELRDAVFGVANDLGIRTLLTGDIADAVIGGSPFVLDTLLRAGDIAGFVRYLRYVRRTSSDSLKKIAALYCVAPFLPLSIRKWAESAYLRRQYELTKGQLAPLWLDDDLRADLAQRHLQMSLDVEKGRKFKNPVRENEFRALYPPEVAPSFSPWPIQAIRPFADRRLHEFLLAIPPQTKFAPHHATDAYYAGSKRLMRHAMRGILPESIRTRIDKTTFSSIMVAEVAREWPRYQEVFGPGGRSELVRRGYVHPERFWARLQWLREGVLLASDAMYLTRMISLEGWLRGFELPRPLAVTPPQPQSNLAHNPPAQRGDVMLAGV